MECLLDFYHEETWENILKILCFFNFMTMYIIHKRRLLEYLKKPYRFKNNIHIPINNYK